MSSRSNGRHARPQSQPELSALSRPRTREGADACLPVGTPAPQQPTIAVPASLAGLLGEFRCCFTAPTFATFCALACGFLAQTGRRTVCGMLVGARLSRVWSHHRAHRFFSRARWSAQQVSLVLARLVVALLVPDGQPVTVAIDDTLFHRRGPKVHAASWFHDGSSSSKRAVGYGNNWVIAAIVVRLPFLDRPVALPAGFALVCKGVDDSRLVLARRLVEQLAVALPSRAIDVVADSAYAGKALRGLSNSITWTTRLRSNAALYQLAPPRTARRGRPRLKGQRLPALAQLADGAVFTATVVHRYGHTSTVQTSVLRCLCTACSVPDRCRSCWSATGTPSATASPCSGRPDHQPGADRRALRIAVEHRGRDRRREADHRLRPGPQPAASRSNAHRPLQARHQHSRDLLVRGRRAPARRRHRRPSAGALVPQQDPALSRRHDRQTPRVIIVAQFQREHPEPVSPREISILRLAWADAAA